MIVATWYDGSELSQHPSSAAFLKVTYRKNIVVTQENTSDLWRCHHRPPTADITHMPVRCYNTVGGLHGDRSITSHHHSFSTKFVDVSRNFDLVCLG